MSLETLPWNYQPYDELWLCSNVFKDVKIPLAINAQPLVLIGKGPVPLIWLAAPSQPNAKTWIYVVKANKAINPGIDVEWSAGTKTVSAKVGGVEVLRVAIQSQQIAEVQFLDLRPLGLDVTGSAGGLTLGTTNTFSRNTVVGARVGINLAVPDAQLVET